MAARPDPIALELFKNAIFSIADEMALTVFRTTYSAVLKDNMDYSTALRRRRRPARRAGPDAAGAPGLGADRHGGDHAPLRRRHGAGRRLHHERSLRRRHAPARHLRHEAALPRGRAPRLRLHRVPPHRRRRPGRRLERLRLHRDLRRRAAHRAHEAVRGGQAQQDHHHLPGEERARARDGAGRSARAARRLPYRREAVRRAGGAARPGANPAVPQRDHRLLRAPDAGRAARPARRRVELRGLDRRRRRRCRQADPPVRHHPQDRRPHGGRLDRHQPAGARRHQQHAVLHQVRVLHGHPLGAAEQHPQQRGRVPRHRGDLPAGHRRQRRAAGGLRRARADRLPHGRLHVRRARHDAARQGQGRRRRRQQRHLHRRLRRGAQAVRLRRVHLRRLGRAPLGRRPQRQLAHVRQPVVPLGRDHRGRAAGLGARLRVRVRQGGRRQVPRRRAVHAASTASTRPRRCCPCAPTARRIGPSASTAAAPACRPRTT